MALYELSIERAHVQEAERLASLEGRSYPTLVMQWESRLFDQPWTTTVVLDYTIALPPLMLGMGTFNEVRIAAYVGGAATKFLYFGTEMTANVPRVGPEMENIVAPAKLYQEFRLEEQSCPVPYLKLIQATPRIYGNGAQDYYSPPIKVERYDGSSGPELIADFFPTIVANLDSIRSPLLTDPNRGGQWIGSRFIGVQSIAILRQGKVVGIHRRMGRTDKDAPPADVKQRDPKLDIVKSWVAIDIGASATVIAVRGERGAAELVRIGPVSAVSVPADYETPSEIAFEHLARAIKAWRDRVILPTTRWEDVHVGFAAHRMRTRPGFDLPERGTSVITNVPMVRERIERKEHLKLRGRSDPDTSEALKRPAPPIIDEEGIGSHDPFDPIELYAYYIGLHLNQRAKGLHTRYAIAMPTGWSPERRLSVLVAIRRGIFRSLPAGMLEYHDLEGLQVVDAGPSAIPFAAYAFRAFGISPRGDSVPFCVIDAGASETGVIFGILRSAKQDEREQQGFDRLIEYLEPLSIPWLGGERLLHRLAYRVYAAHEASMRELDLPMERPIEEGALPNADAMLLSTSPEARANTQILKDLVRPLLEPARNAKVVDKIRLIANDGTVKEVAVSVDREPLLEVLQGWFNEAVGIIKGALDEAIAKIGREPTPYEGLHILLGGRVGLHQGLADELLAQLPPVVKIHRFKEPDGANLAAPTVKTACALGVLAMKFDRVGAGLRSEKRDAFKFRVGRNRHGQLADALDPSVDYDTWREMGACTKPDVDILFMPAEDDGEVAADDPRVKRATCSFGTSAVGRRVYVRAVAPARVEVSVGPPGGEPEKSAVRWGVDLAAAKAEAIR
jgi:hypothetical protein